MFLTGQIKSDLLSSASHVHFDQARMTQFTLFIQLALTNINLVTKTTLVIEIYHF